MNKLKTNPWLARPMGILFALAVAALCLGTASAQQHIAKTDPVLLDSSIEQELTPQQELVLGTEPDELRVLLRPHREAIISSLVSAQIKTIHLKDGDRFSAGDPMFSFKCETQNAKLNTMRARLKQHRLIHAANLELRKDNAVSQLDLALSGAKVEEGEADVALAVAQRRKCEVHAPFDGRVVKLLVNVHESAEIGTPLISILDDEQLNVTLHAPSHQVMSLTPGQRFKVSIDETEGHYDAFVLATVPRIDPTSRTVEVNGRIEGKHSELLAGMSGTATFENAQ